MALPPFLEKIVDWLRAGYPEGVPPTDYIPLIALLGSQLTGDELILIAHELANADDHVGVGAVGSRGPRGARSPRKRVQAAREERGQARAGDQAEHDDLPERGQVNPGHC